MNEIEVRVDQRSYPDRIRVRMRPELEELAKQVPAYNRVSAGLFSWPATPFVAGAMVQAFRGRQVDFDDEWLALYNEYEEIMLLGVAGNLYPAEPVSKTSSWPHQRRAYQFLRFLSSSALLAEMRTGKTKVAVDLVVNRGHHLTLVVCPKSAMETWRKEVETHAARPILVKLLSGSNQQRVEDLDSIKERPAIFVLNYEALVYEEIQKALLRLPWSLVILDEAHRIKSPSGKTSKFLASFGLRVPHRMVLTGTPMSERPLDIFGIYRFLDPGIFGLSYTDFKNRYALVERRVNSSGQTYDRIAGYRRLDELHDKVYQIAFRVTQDILSLPDRMYIQHPVRLEPESWRVYKQMEEHSIVQLRKDEETTAANVLARMLRLQQITSGFLKIDEDNDRPSKIERMGKEKTEALREILEQTLDSEPVVVFCRFTEDLREVRKATSDLGRVVYELSGKQNQLAAWQEDTSGSVLAVQLQAGGTGIDLSRANLVVYYSLSFSLAEYEQSKSRILRDGQTKQKTYYHLVAKNTIDEIVYQALQYKADVAHYVIDELRKKGVSSG